MTKQQTEAKLGEVLHRLKHPEYGATFLIIERPSGLEGLKAIVEDLLDTRVGTGLKGIDLCEANRLYGDCSTNFLSFWITTKHKQNESTKRIPVIKNDRAKFKSLATKIFINTFYPGCDRDEITQSYLLIARLRKRRQGQKKLYESLHKELSELSNQSREVDRLNLNSNHYVIATVFEKTS